MNDKENGKSIDKKQWRCGDSMIDEALIKECVTPKVQKNEKLVLAIQGTIMGLVLFFGIRKELKGKKEK